MSLKKQKHANIVTKDNELVETGTSRNEKCAEMPFKMCMNNLRSQLERNARASYLNMK
jgi:hypothetical protein